MSERTAQRHLAELEKDGLIRIERRGGRHLSNRYFVVAGNPADLTGNPADLTPFREKPRQFVQETPSKTYENPVKLAPQSLVIPKEPKGGTNHPLEFGSVLLRKIGLAKVKIDTIKMRVPYTDVDRAEVKEWRGKINSWESELLS